MDIGICYICKSRLKKNEGYYKTYYQLFGQPFKWRICFKCMKVKRYYLGLYL